LVVRLQWNQPLTATIQQKFSEPKTIQNCQFHCWECELELPSFTLSFFGILFQINYVITELISVETDDHVGRK
jgi:hypothetical protein